MISTSGIPSETERLLLTTSGADSLSRRMAIITSHLLGRPYISNPLPGSARTRERMLVRMDGFDCVTFVESVLALALSASPTDLALYLRRIRYLDGQVSWWTRNHYMSLWLERNQQAGHLRLLDGEPWITEDHPRLLSCLPGFPPLARTLTYLPLELAHTITPNTEDGDIVLFVSQRNDLDTFHLGLLFTGEGLLLRHAARSAGSVIQEPFTAFLDRNQLPGIILARPRDPSQNIGKPTP